MRLELIMFVITAFILHNIYTEGKTIRMAMKYKKYYHMIGIVCFSIFLYYVFKHNPKKIEDIVLTSQDYMKYLPIDSHTTSILNPILDFTKKNQYFRNLNMEKEGENLIPLGELKTNSTSPPTTSIPIPPNIQQNKNNNVLPNAEIKKTKRSVSETKKKWVASLQNWKCDECNKMLPPWFEVDHIIRLEYGGSNEVSNLRALCRDCHGKKTSMENL